MTRQHSAGLLVLHAHFYTFASRLPTVDWRMPNRYYYYNNSGAVAATTVAIACQRCTCRFCSLLCWHCILLRRFDNSFYLRQDEDEDVADDDDAGRRLFVCHLRPIPSTLHLPNQVQIPQFNSQWRSSFLSF